MWARLRDSEYRNELLAVAVMLVAIQLLPRRMPLGVYVQSLSSASMLLLHAVGVILVFRANRLINFAQVPLALAAGGLFLALIQGQFMLNGLRSVCGCVSREPGPLVRNVHFVIAFFLALGFVAGLSWLASLTLLTRFRRSPRVMVTLVTIFVGQVLAGAIGGLNGVLMPDGDALQRAQLRTTQPPGEFAWKIGQNVTLHQSDVLLVLVGIAAVVGLAFYLRHSATGIAMRAAAESPARAATLGVDVQRVSARVWFIAGLLAAAAGIISSFGGAASRGSEPVIPAAQLSLILAVAVMARFHSLPMAALGAVTLGILDRAVQYAYSSAAPLEASFVFLVGGLLLLQRSRRSHRERDDTAGSEITREARPVPHELRRLPQVRTWVRGVAAAVAILGVGLPWAMSPSSTTIITTHVIYAVIGLSLLILTGWAGQVSLGQFGFVAIGAWAAASTHLPFPLALLLGGAAGAAASVVVGLPALKLRGLNLAVTTLAFAVTARALFIDDRYLGGLLPESVDRPSVLGMDLDDTRVFYYFCLLVLAASCVAVMGMRRSRFGRVLIGLRANEAAGQSFGVSVLRTRLTAFAVAGFLAAFAGALLPFLHHSAVAASFGPDMSVKVFMYAVIGGLGGILGPLLGFSFMAVLSLFSASPFVRAMASGSLALLILMAAPGGLAQLVYDTRDAALRRLAVRLRIPVPSLMGDRRADDAMARARLDEPRGRGALDPALLYKPVRQWALDRYGRAEDTGERVGARKGVAARHG